MSDLDRRSFLRAALAGVVSAWLDVRPRELAGPRLYPIVFGRPGQSTVFRQISLSPERDRNIIIHGADHCPTRVALGDIEDALEIRGDGTLEVGPTRLDDTSWPMGPMVYSELIGGPT
jgi:hypothetical protein